jgi:hypothetical protein
MSDGHLNKCKVCTKKDVTKHRLENIESIREYDRNRAKNIDRKNQGNSFHGFYSTQCLE